MSPRGADSAKSSSGYPLALLCLFFLAAAPLSCVSPQGSKQTSKPGAAGKNVPEPNVWEQQMIRVNAASDTIEDGIAGKKKEEVLAAVNEMRDAFNQVRGIPPPKGGADLFRQYVEAGSGVLRDVEDHVQHSYWEKAQASFARIKDLQKDIEKDFAPGIWSRIKLWNAR